MKYEDPEAEALLQTEAKQNGLRKVLINAFLCACPIAFILGWNSPDLSGPELLQLMGKCAVGWVIAAAVFGILGYKKAYCQTVKRQEKERKARGRREVIARHKAQNAQQAAPQPGLLRCPHCGAVMHRPAGSGRVRIQCPNPGCGSYFETTL